MITYLGQPVGTCQKTSQLLGSDMSSFMLKRDVDGEGNLTLYTCNDAECHQCTTLTFSPGECQVVEDGPNEFAATWTTSTDYLPVCTTTSPEVPNVWLSVYVNADDCSVDPTATQPTASWFAPALFAKQHQEFFGRGAFLLSGDKSSAEFQVFLDGGSPDEPFSKLTGVVADGTCYSLPNVHNVSVSVSFREPIDYCVGPSVKHGIADGYVQVECVPFGNSAAF